MVSRSVRPGANLSLPRVELSRQLCRTRPGVWLPFLVAVGEVRSADSRDRSLFLVLEY